MIAKLERLIGEIGDLNSKLILLVGPSRSGKATLRHAARDRDEFARVEEMCFVLPNQVVVVAVNQMVLPVKPLQHGFDVCGLFGKADIAEVVHSVLRGNDAVPAVDQVFVQLVGVIAL